jgi:fructose-specific phosphotransferase system IIC component
MELIGLFVRFISNAFGFVVHQIYTLIIGPCLSDASYRSGFIGGLITALVIGYTSRQLLYWWNRVLQFFSPTKQPATKGLRSLFHL